MAHEIEDNRYISTTNDWHNEGVQSVVGLTVEQAIKQVTRDETLVKLPLQGVLPDGLTLEAPESFGIYRTDGKYLGHCGPRFELVQIQDDFGRYQELADTGLIELTSAGLLDNGRKFFMTAKVKDSEREVVKNDRVDLYFTMAGGLCGNMTHRTFESAIKSVCANTVAIAQREGKKNGSFQWYKHTKGIHGKLDQWVVDVKQSLVNWDDTIQAYKAIAAKEVKSDKVLQAYVDQVFEVDRTKEVSTKLDNKVRYVCSLFDTQKGADLMTVPSYWKAYNAVTQYLTHDHGHNEDNRLDSLMFGESARVSKRALELAINA